MPLFRLNLFNDMDVLDDEGQEVPDLATAKERAITGARELMAEHIMIGRPINLSHRIEVADDGGNVLATIPFRELITVVDE
jgi:class 3 adenylate cyclase